MITEDQRSGEEMRPAKNSSLYYDLMCLLNMFVPCCFLTGSELDSIWGNDVLSQTQCQGLSKIKQERTSAQFPFLLW